MEMESSRGRRVIDGIATTTYAAAPPQGRPVTLIMVHGGDPRSLSNALDWSTIWEPEVVGAGLFAYDKPGQGRSYSSLMPPSAVGARHLSRHLERILESARGPLVLMGHSRGALLTADVALRRPDLIEALVLVSSNTLAPHSAATPKGFYPKAYEDPPQAPESWYIRREPEMNSYSSEHINDAFIAGRYHAALENGWWDDLGRRSRLYRDVAQPTLKRMQDRVLGQLDATGFAMPVLQIWGHQDVSAPVALGHALFERIAVHDGDATSIVINHSGHYVYREQANRFMAVLGAFIRTIH